MVCVPCFIIPVLLWLWHKFIQPLLLKYWNPWEKKDTEGNVIKPEFPFECKGDQCPFPRKEKPDLNEDKDSGAVKSVRPTESGDDKKEN